MATDLRSENSRPIAKRITLSGTADNLTEVQIPTWAWRVTVEFIGAAGKIAFTGTDGAAIGTDYLTIPGDSIYEIGIRHGADHKMFAGSIYLASATASLVVEVGVE